MRDSRPVESQSALRWTTWGRAGRALRASGWWYFSLLPLTSLVGEADGVDIGRLLAGVAVAALCLAYAYGFNGIADRGMDRDAGKNALAGLVELPREAAVLVGACAAGALLIAAALSPVALVATGVSLVAATLYSARLRLKRLPIVGTLVNMLIFAPLPFVGARHLPSPEMLVLAYCFCVLVTQNQLLHEIADRHEDASGGVRTTAVVVGAAGLRAIAVLLGPVAALLLWRMPAAPLTALAATLGLSAGAAMIALGDMERAAQWRVAHRWYSLGIGALLFALVARGAA